MRREFDRWWNCKEEWGKREVVKKDFPTDNGQVTDAGIVLDTVDQKVKS